MILGPYEKNHVFWPNPLPLPQTTGNAFINCINVAHKKYESNAMDWQQVIELAGAY
jgi:hypothetical protein